MFKIFTLNIDYYGERHGPWTVRIGLIREAIADACPDVIALQAVRQDPSMHAGEDQAAQLARLMRRDYPYVVYKPGMCYTNNSTDGSAFLSRRPLAELGQVTFDVSPGSDDNIQRELLHARVDLTSGPLHLFNAHLSWVPEQAGKNMRQALPFLRSFSGPAVLVGDLNNPPDSDVFDGLRQAGWTDVWAALRPTEDGFTFFESGDLVKRIDYVWVNEDLRSKIVDVQIVAGEEASIDARPSDHTGLLAAFDLEAAALPDCERL